MIKVEKAKNNFTIEMRIFDNQNHELWHSVIKPWFQPERFGITYLWFHSGFSHIGYGEYHIIRTNRWLKTPIERIIYLGIGFLPIRNISPIELGF